MIQNPVAKSELLDLIYPVGSVYINVKNVSPEDFLGGIWEQIQGRFLLAASSTYPVGSTGGEATHTLTINEMPSHTHGLTGAASTGTTGHSLVYQEKQYQFLNTAPSGGGQAHNNMPPYLSVYMWKRTG